MRPSILGFFTVGMTTLSMLSVSCVLYSAGSDCVFLVVTLMTLKSWTLPRFQRHQCDDQE